MNDRVFFLSVSKPPRLLLGAVLACLGACIPAKLELFDSSTTTDAGGGSTTASSGATTSADPITGAGTTDEPSTTAGTTDGGPVSCFDPNSDCSDDQDRDNIPFACDNAPSQFNPDQIDMDNDGFGNIADLCPTVPSASNTADSDRDGIGNDCDLCARSIAAYNEGGGAIPVRMQVRNIPQVEDSDQDGVGDACDNCVRTPNCQGYGDGLDPFALGDPIDPEASDCQTDADNDNIGDACAGAMLPGAAGPVGFGNADDFDQDGLANIDDGCPRQPVALQACDGPEDCVDGGACTAGVCNHSDTDNDGVGDICDTCPWNPNPLQVQDGGAQQDDPDADFVGSACESDVACYDRANPRLFGFYDGSVNGYCCVQLSATGTVLDPHGETVAIPPGVLATPGVGSLPSGCTQEAQPVSPDLGADTLWASFCLLPQLDQDFDGDGDVCDLCPFAFDPDQVRYVDEDDKEWEEYGKYCNGEFHPSELDPSMMCLPGT